FLLKKVYLANLDYLQSAPLDISPTEKAFVTATEPQPQREPKPDQRQPKQAAIPEKLQKSPQVVLKPKSPTKPESPSLVNEVVAASPKSEKSPMKSNIRGSPAPTEH